MAMCSNPLASAASVPGVICRCRVAAAAVGVVADRRRSVRRPGSSVRENTASRAAWFRPDCCPPGESFRRPESQPEEKANRDRYRTLSGKPQLPRTYKIGRCNRFVKCGAPRERTFPAGKLFRWSGRRRRKLLRHLSHTVSVCVRWPRRYDPEPAPNQPGAAVPIVYRA